MNLFRSRLASSGAGLPFRQYGRVFPFLRPYAIRFVPLFALSFLSTLVTLAQPYLTKLLIDDGLQHRSFRNLQLFALAMGVFALLAFGIGILTSYLYTKLSALILFDMRLAAFQKLQRLSPQYFASTKMGDVVSRVNNDIGELQRLSADTLLSLPSNLLFLVGNAAAMFFLNKGMFLVSILMVPAGLWAMTRYQGRLRTQVGTLRQRSSDIGSFLIESILGIRLLTSCNAGDRKNEEFRGLNQRFIDGLLAMQITSFLAGALPGAVLTASVAILFLYGGNLVIQGALTIGSLMAFMAYHGRLLSPLQSLMASYSALVTGSVSLVRVFELLDQHEDVAEPDAALAFSTRTGSIAFDHVSFAFAGRHQTLDHVSFTVEPHSICVVVGPSGAGKSTATDLLLRFYDPQAGTIFLHGTDIKQVSLQQLRETIASVEQTPFFFNTTIRDNLLFAKPDASPDELDSSMAAAGLTELLASLPDGYDTILGERGLKLSAGQRQRLAVARALLRSPDILILDEPSAALDPEAERDLCATVRTLSDRCTVLVVTHRPALVAIADQVVVLANGRVLESGQPQDLRQLGSLFPRQQEPSSSALTRSAAGMAAASAA